MLVPVRFSGNKTSGKIDAGVLLFKISKATLKMLI